MKIVILAGGTGSIALQTGLYNLFKNLDGIDIKVLVNAYDSGLSTGQVRQVMGGEILGPSDVRKNQTTRLELENPGSPWLNFLNIRFTAESSKAYEFCIGKINELNEKIHVNGISVNSIAYMLKWAVDTYFKIPVASKIDYTNFALANIVYAGLAKLHQNSLRKAASIMADFMGIKDTVLLNDDTSLFLGAITKSGKRVADEGDIVSWDNHEDPFVDIFFTNVRGIEDNPILCNEATNVLLDADLIILSSGTQWSSLIPTYASINFKRVISQCNAKIIMVMNRIPDRDSPSQTASDIINILVPKYFESDQLHVLLDKHGHDSMCSLSKEAIAKIKDHMIVDLQACNETSKHDPNKLAVSIGLIYFKNYLNSDYYLFDYDDTLIGRGNLLPKSSNENARMISVLNHFLNIGICTGNTIKAINLRGHASSIDGDTFKPNYKSLTIYADGGINKYKYDTRLFYETEDSVKSVLEECISPSSLITPLTVNRIIEELENSGIPSVKIDNRNNAVIAIKPIDPEYRKIIASLVKYIISEDCLNLEVRQTGRTTIEICSKDLSKTTTIFHILNTLKPRTITYVGDEFFDGGNDLAIANLNDNRIKILHVNTPAKTAFFLLALMQTI